ncbi:flavin reductase family protein [Nocardia pseudobrasiliensis]|uniref:Flavin reductase (DIM6/NTAB) family NADH-FMN oxidoreductase RutF n=1 Tax=Nocardia pseudobrasiliensis TaxID=45979 RepID=A0A370I9W4_9NOCA|nr:flavin reductase family protein [Nocardia pseudobrasiliensis]RDI67505.1 flavin reductase (DIM6/NTAB) family NADH-FMN oxidoreductase RutF [Nocardia pseudobrasiliensis]
MTLSQRAGEQFVEPAVAWSESELDWAEPSSAAPVLRPAGARAEIDLRGAMRNFVTGVAVVTTHRDGAHDAVTVNSLVSLSLEPPLVAISLRRDSRFGADLLATREWNVCILHGESATVAGSFARDRETRTAALAALPTRPGVRTGALLLDAPGWLECVLDRTYEVGDHTLFIGAVVAAGTDEPGARLLFANGRFHVFDHSPRPGGTP